MVPLLRRASRAAVDLLFPPQCALCRKFGVLLCDDCFALLPPADGRRCARCWLPVERSTLCRHCAETPPSFQELRAAYVMDGGARRLAHELKYEGMTSLAAPMSMLMSETVGAADVDLVVPVPLHGWRQRSRGYNQSALLARALAECAGLAYDGQAARRTRATAPLVKTMHRTERLAIMRGAFAGRRERVDGRRLLLVDDVATTGATLDACGEALLGTGARSVRCIVWARAD